VREKQRAENRGFIKKEVNAEFDDQLRAQYELAQLEGRVKGEYVDQQEER